MKDSLSYADVPGNNFWEKLLFLNSATDYFIAVVLLVGCVLAIRMVHMVVKRWLKKKSQPWVEYSVEMTGYAIPIVYAVVIYAMISWLDFPIQFSKVIRYAFIVATTLLVIRLVASAASLAISVYVRRHWPGDSKIKQVRGIVLIITGVVWIIGLIVLFNNLGFDVSAIIAGLGVGGIAIALAAQNIVGDIFNYFVIFFDKPFEVGDFIIVDDKMGTVEYIGIKTTRLRSLSGEQLIFSNGNLTNSRMHNYRRMNERRIVFGFGVPYDTDRTALGEIPDTMRLIVQSIPQTRFDRAHFARYGQYSLDFEIVYYVLSADYNRYMDIQQHINLALFDAFRDREIEFARPTYIIRSGDNADRVGSVPSAVMN